MVNRAVLKALCEQNDFELRCAQLADGTRLDGYVVVDPDSGGKSTVWCLFGTDVPLDPQPAPADLEPCSDPEKPCCEESQEWTYGLDNTGTRYNWDNVTYLIELSDGATLTFTQTATAGWTPQVQQWSTLIQAAADSAGLAWFVEPRFRFPADPSNLSGGGGFPGPPSVAVSQVLTSMAWRYVNIQICPGNPVPVNMTILEFPAEPGREGQILTTDGPVLGPIQRFYVCRDCGTEPVWYLADGVTLAEAGQIPDCPTFPCGTIQLFDDPPASACPSEFEEGCDNVGSTDPDDWVSITRRLIVCDADEPPIVEFYVADPDDPTALIEYTLVGQFVDCETGALIEVPVPDCTIEATLGRSECPDADDPRCVQFVEDTWLNRQIEAVTGECSVPADLEIDPDSGNVVIRSYASSYEGAHSFTGLGSAGISGGFGPPDDDWAIAGRDGVDGPSGGINTGSWGIDTSALPTDCDPVAVTLHVYAGAFDENDTPGGPIADVISDGNVWALEIGGTQIAPDSVTIGGISNYVPTTGIESNPADVVAGSTDIEAVYTLTAADIAAGVSVFHWIDNDANADNDTAWHYGNPAVNAIELIAEYAPDSPCFVTEPTPVLNVGIQCSTELDVNLTNETIQVEIVEPPEQPVCEVTYLAGCDDVNGDGTDIVVYRIPIVTCTLAGQIVSTEQQAPILEDGTEYTPVNPIDCDPSSFPDAEPIIMCDEGTGQTFTQFVTVIASDQVVIVNVLPDGTTPYVPVGPVSVGACTIPQPEPDVEACGTRCTISFDGRVVNGAGGFAGVVGVGAFPGGPVNGGANLVAALADIGLEASYLGFVSSDIQQVVIYSDINSVYLDDGTRIAPVCEDRQAMLVKVCNDEDPEPVDKEILLLCDEAGDPYVACYDKADPDNPPVVLDLLGEVQEVTCATQSVRCTGTTRLTNDGLVWVRLSANGVQVNTPADWATLTDAEQLQWVIDNVFTAQGFPGYYIDGSGRICGPNDPDPGTLSTLVGFSLSAQLWLQTSQTVCTGVELGDLSVCDDFTVQADPYCNTLPDDTSAQVTLVLVFNQDGEQVGRLLLDLDGNPVAEGELTPGLCPPNEPVEECVTAVGPAVVDITAGGTQTLLAGQRYTIFVTEDGFTLDGAPIPCGTVLHVPDCCGCTLDADITVGNTSGNDIQVTVIAEAQQTQMVSQKKLAAKQAASAEIVRAKAFVKKESKKVAEKVARA